MRLIWVLAFATLSIFAHADQISSVPGLSYQSTENKGILHISDISFRAVNGEIYAVRFEDKSGQLNIPYLICAQLNRRVGDVSFILPKYVPVVTGQVIWIDTLTGLGTRAQVPRLETLDRWQARLPSVGISLDPVDHSRVVLSGSQYRVTRTSVEPQAMTEKDFLSHPDLRSLIIVRDFDCLEE